MVKNIDDIFNALFSGQKLAEVKENFKNYTTATAKGSDAMDALAKMATPDLLVPKFNAEGARIWTDHVAKTYPWMKIPGSCPEGWELEYLARHLLALREDHPEIVESGLCKALGMSFWPDSTTSLMLVERLEGIDRDGLDALENMFLLIQQAQTTKQEQENPLAGSW